MADNVIKSTDLKLEDKKPAKKAPAKKAVAKKETVEKIEKVGIKDGHTLVVFESGASYVSNDIRFTKDNRIQEVPDQQAQSLLQLDNFRQANLFELENYIKTKEV